MIEDAKDLVYSHETLSLTPPGYQTLIQPLPKPPTFAELAVIPIHKDAEHGGIEGKHSLSKENDTDNIAEFSEGESTLKQAKNKQKGKDKNKVTSNSKLVDDHKEMKSPALVVPSPDLNADL